MQSDISKSEVPAHAQDAAATHASDVVLLWRRVGVLKAEKQQVRCDAP